MTADAENPHPSSPDNPASAPNRPGSVTYRQIARAAGVGIATVSRALNGDPRTSRATRERIQQLAAEMGYVRSPSAALLASRRFRKGAGSSLLPVAWIAPSGATSAGQLQYFQRAGLSLGHKLELYPIPTDQSPKRFGEILYSRGVEGLFIDPRITDQRFLRDFDWSPFCVVSVDRTFEDPTFHSISKNAFLAVQMAWHQATSRGYQRIGFVLFEHPGVHPDDDLRMGSLLRLQQSVPEERRIPPFFLQGAAFLTEDFEAIPAWLEEHRPDCIVGFSAWTGIGLQDHGYQFPRDMGFISLTSTPDETHGFCGVRPRRHDTGRAAMEFLDQLYRHGDRGIPRSPRSVQIPPAWQEGRSLRPPLESEE